MGAASATRPTIGKVSMSVSVIRAPGSPKHTVCLPLVPRMPPTTFLKVGSRWLMRYEVEVERAALSALVRLGEARVELLQGSERDW